MLDAGLLNPGAGALLTDMDPLIITSPTPRCGTTLLQRLLCSSSKALIYGEKCAQDLEMFLNIYTFKTQDYTYQRESYRRELQKVLQGEVNGWIMELAPDIDGYLAALQNSAFAGAIYCRDYALQAGRPVWGFKYPGWSPTTLRLLRAYLPGSRFIFILRDIVACLKSAKAQHLVITEQNVRAFCRQWLDGAAFARAMDGDRAVLVVNFEDLVERQEETLAKISLFSGIEDMDRSVLNHKINIWVGQGFAAQSKDGYVPPAELAEAELAIIAEMIAPVPQPGA